MIKYFWFDSKNKSNNWGESFMNFFEKATPESCGISSNFTTHERKDNADTIATAIWHTKKDLEITLRLIATPAIVKVIADFSKEPKVEIVSIRCKI